LSPFTALTGPNPSGLWL